MVLARSWAIRCSEAKTYSFELNVWYGKYFTNTLRISVEEAAIKLGMNIIRKDIAEQAAVSYR